MNRMHEEIDAAVFDMTPEERVKFVENMKRWGSQAQHKKNKEPAALSRQDLRTQRLNQATLFFLLLIFGVLTFVFCHPGTVERIELSIGMVSVLLCEFFTINALLNESPAGVLDEPDHP